MAGIAWATLSLWSSAQIHAQAPPAPPAQGASAPSVNKSARYTISSWQGHRKCPGQERFRQELEEALGPETSESSQSPPMQVSIALKRRRGNFYLELATKDENGEGTRELHAPGCDELIRTAAVIVSLAMQPDLLFENEKEGSVAVAPAGQGQASDDEKPSAIYGISVRRNLLSYRDRADYQIVRVSLSLAAVADMGTLPRTAIGTGIIASAHTRRMRLSFRLTQWAEQREYVRSFKEDRGGNFDYLSASLHLCGNLYSGSVLLGACGVLGLGRLKGESIAIDLPTAQTHIMANAGPGVFLTWPTGRRSALRVQGEVVAQLVRPNYSAVVLDPEDDTMEITRQIHQPGFVAAHLAASWGLAF